MELGFRVDDEVYLSSVVPASYVIQIQWIPLTTSSVTVLRAVGYNEQIFFRYKRTLMIKFKYNEYTL